MPAVPVQIGTISDTALQYARDYLEGYQGQYLFYQYSENVYYLFLSDKIEETQDGTGIFVDAPYTSIRLTYDDYDVSQIPPDSPSHWLSHKYVSTNTTFTFVPYTDMLYYCSVGFNPRLIDGGEFYGFSTVACLCIGFGFVLCSRIFRRLI